MKHNKNKALQHYLSTLLIGAMMMPIVPLAAQLQQTNPPQWQQPNPQQQQGNPEWQPKPQPEQPIAQPPDWDRRPDVMRGELARMDQFLDDHPEIARELQKNPKLIDDQKFVADHPALQQFLADHPGIKEQFDEHPDAFMRAEDRYDRNNPDITHGELANMDRFLDSHPEIAQQLQKDPKLIDDKKFVADHPALQQFLADHPGVRQQFDEHPYAFMHREDAFDRHEDSGVRGHADVSKGDLLSFHEFLEAHNDVAGELSKNPSLANNQEFLENHPALRDYLQANPSVHEELSQSPQTFLASAQQMEPKGTPKPPIMPRDK